MIKILQLLLFSNILLSDSLTFYDLEAISITGDTISMSKYSGKNVLIVNVASNCGFTSQYTDLQKLYTEYNNNLEILGFPSNDFLTWVSLSVVIRLTSSPVSTLLSTT